MLEYNILDLSKIELNDINALGKDGWHVVCMNGNLIVMEREISPKVEEIVTDTEHKVIYTFPL